MPQGEAYAAGCEEGALLGGFLGALVAVAVLGLVVATELGWIELASVVDTVLIVVAVGGLVSVTKVPWDLYLQARGVVAEQERSDELGVAVVDRDRRAARALSTRLLWVSVGLHLGLAVAAAAVAVWRDATAGYLFAATFVLTTGLRPAWAWYARLSQRLGEMHQRARYPRNDVLELQQQVRDLSELRGELHRLESEWGVHQKANAEELKHGKERIDRLQNEVGRAKERVATLRRHFEQAVDRATEGAETLDGLRALVRLIKGA